VTGAGRTTDRARTTSTIRPRGSGLTQESVAGMKEQDLATAAPMAEAKETEQEGGQKTDEESGMQKRCLRRYYDASCRAEPPCVHHRCTGPKTSATMEPSASTRSRIKRQIAEALFHHQLWPAQASSIPFRDILGTRARHLSVGKKRAIVEA